jgi:hypothetical protein
MGPRDGPDDVEKRKFLTLPGLEIHLKALQHLPGCLYTSVRNRLQEISGMHPGALFS